MLVIPRREAYKLDNPWHTESVILVYNSLIYGDYDDDNTDATDYICNKLTFIFSCYHTINDIYAPMHADMDIRQYHKYGG